MNIYIITYDLNKSGQNYDKVINSINSKYPRNKKILESTFIIKSEKTAVQIYDSIEGLDHNDRIFIGEINRKNQQGWLTTELWNWINA